MNELYHYGTKYHSGRYPYGSGDDPYQHDPGHFLSSIKELKKSGMTDKQIADGFNMTINELRAARSIAKDKERAAKIAQIKKIQEENPGISNVQIGKMLGINESSVRSLLDPNKELRTDFTKNAAQLLKDNIESGKKYLDVGAGVNYEIMDANGAPISETRLKTALSMLEAEGYNVYYVPVQQMGTNHKTTVKVLAPPGTTYSELYQNRDQIQSVANYSVDSEGKTALGIQPPKPIARNRVFVRYNEEGGVDKDGVIEIRPGVEDVSLGGASYAQVRIAVGDKGLYAKGMAMYSNEIPEGYDILINSNKHVGSPDDKVFKKMKDDPDNPFGATINAEYGQRTYIDENGKKQLSVINKVNQEGEWDNWSKTLSAQMLSKQPLELIQRQLDLTYSKKLDEYNDIMALDNPTVRRKLLEDFSDDCDASAVHLKAEALPRQAAHVILPVNDLKDNEIYAPNYKDGETVCLIRYPHSGVFEIPQLKVNNKNAVAKELIGNATDAVGININVAKQLSGADFDGDTVTVIPANSRFTDVKLNTAPILKGLKDWDHLEIYATDESKPTISPDKKQMEMGKVSNLITDMTLKGAPLDDIEFAVKHSMVIIDAEKHKLDWKKSEQDNHIAELKAKWQGGANKGASTLISKASSETHIPERKQDYKIDPKTGKKIYTETGRTYMDKKTGKEVLATESSTKMADTDDAFTLSSGHAKETAYANYANKMKALANQSRLDMINTPTLKYSPTAKETYKDEVDSLNVKLVTALKNAPRERQAQIIANSVFDAKKEANPQMTKEQAKKTKSQALAAARTRVGAHKETVEITDKEWQAIQAGAISDSKLMQILNNSNMETVKKLATPKTTTSVPDAKISRMKAMASSGYTTSEIADATGFSVSTVRKYI